MICLLGLTAQNFAQTQILPVQISAGDFHSVAIKNDGTMWVWGANDQSQTGLTQSIEPISVSANRLWKSVFASYSTTFAIDRFNNGGTSLLAI